MPELAERHEFAAVKLRRPSTTASQSPDFGSFSNWRINVRAAPSCNRAGNRRRRSMRDYAAMDNRHFVGTSAKYEL